MPGQRGNEKKNGKNTIYPTHLLRSSHALSLLEKYFTKLKVFILIFT